MTRLSGDSEKSLTSFRTAMVGASTILWLNSDNYFCR